MAQRRQRTTDATLAVGYVRASTDDQALGPDAQRAALQAYCDRAGLTLAVVHEDLGISGATPLDRRPGMVAALASLTTLRAGVLLVAKRDRLARDVMSAMLIDAAAGKAGARVVSCAGEGTDSDDPTALLLRRMLDAFAEYERLQIKARTRAALAVKKARGERTGGIPYGKRLAEDGRTLVDDPDELLVRELIGTLRAEGLTLRAIVDRLNQEAIPCRGARWHLPHVARVARAEVASSEVGGARRA